MPESQRYHIPERAVQEVVTILLKYSYGSDDQGTEEIKEESIGAANKISDLEDIEQLETQVEELEALLLSLSSGIRSHIAGIRCRRNQLLPIYRLPFELLASIFQAVEWSASQQKISVVAKTLCEVSSHWRKTAIAVPQLWNVIDCRDSYSWRELALERSGNIPLEIYCPWGAKGHSDVLEQVAPHKARWKVIKSFFHPFTQSLAQLEGDLPLLDTLECPRMDDSNSTVPWIVLNNASQLHNLDIIGYEFPVGVMFGRLRSLSFKASVDGVPLTSEQWEVFLEENQQLEYIYAEGRIVVAHEALLPEFDAYLPMLRYLSLDKLPQSSINVLVSSIHPNFDLKPRLHINLLHSPTGSRSFPATFSAGSLWGLIYSSSWMSLSEGAFDTTRLRAGVQDEGYWLDIEETTTNKKAGGLFKAIAPPGGFLALKTLTIDGNYIFPKARSVTQLGLLFPNLQHLVINYPTRLRPDYPGDVLGILSSPIFSKDGTGTRWPVERLSVLSIEISGWRGFQEMITFVEHRYGVGLICTANLVPLKVLRVTNLSGEKDRPSLESGVVGDLREELKEIGAELEILVKG